MLVQVRGLPREGWTRRSHRAGFSSIVEDTHGAVRVRRARRNGRALTTSNGKMFGGASAQVEFLGVPTLKGPPSIEARWRVGGNAHQPRASPSAMPRGGKLKPDPGQRSLAGATPQEEASPASGHLRSLSISDEATRPLTRLVPPFHSQVSASRAWLPSPSPSRRHWPSRRMTLPRPRCLAVEVPASPPPRALDGTNQAGRSNRRAGRWRMCPGARRPPRSSPARPRSCTPST